MPLIDTENALANMRQILACPHRLDQERMEVPFRAPCSTSPGPVIDLGKDTVQIFDLVQPELVNLRGRKLLVQGVKAQEVFSQPLLGILRACSSAHDERPVTALGQQ